MHARTMPRWCYVTGEHLLDEREDRLAFMRNTVNLAGLAGTDNGAALQVLYNTVGREKGAREGREAGGGTERACA